MSREIMPKWCKTKPTIESEYMCAIESCDDHLYIYDLLRINSIIIATLASISKVLEKTIR